MTGVFNSTEPNEINAWIGSGLNRHDNSITAWYGGRKSPTNFIQSVKKSIFVYIIARKPSVADFPGKEIGTLL